jgi:hypothetical protein
MRHRSKGVLLRVMCLPTTLALPLDPYVDLGSPVIGSSHVLEERRLAIISVTTITVIVQLLC